MIPNLDKMFIGGLGSLAGYWYHGLVGCSVALITVATQLLHSCYTRILG